MTLRFRGLAIIWPQGALRLPPHSTPEPDLIVGRPRADRYGDADPVPEGVLLVVEVSDPGALERGSGGRGPGLP